jgi:ribosome biogenesis GTPase / thiamine phosphate phosphatase
VVTATLGTVLEREGSAYRVGTGAEEVRAVLRGKAKLDTPKVVVGDVVRLETEPGGELHAIVGIEPRRTVLERRVPEGRGVRPIAANIDQVFVVAATRSPDPIPQLIDRLLVLAEADSIAAAVVLNKVDLDPGTAVAERCRKAGYPVHLTSVKTGEGVDSLKLAMSGMASVVTGPSGVGKSSLLNAIQPGLRLRTGEVSRRIRRGTNTTVSSVMIPLERGGYLVDTPGFSEVGMWGVDPRSLADCFPDFRPFLGDCRYADCRHRNEPGCLVREALENGGIAPDRYQSYLVLLEELEAQPREWE